MHHDPLEAAGILIVDDEIANVRVLEQMLDEWRYRNIASTTDPRAVHALYTQFQPDILLLDLIMPGLDGFAVMAQLRSVIPPNSYLPILVLTADPSTPTRRKALAAGANDFLTKPFDAVELSLRVRTLLQTRFLHRQLADQNRLKDEFLSNMSHELRTPLNAIIGFAELMRDGKVGPVSDVHKQYLGNILNSSRHLLQISNDILDLAKVRSGTIAFWQEEVDLEKVTGEVCAILRALADKAQISIEASVDPTLTRVVTDASRFKQVLYNYLSNAVKFTPDRGRVAIRVLSEGLDSFRLEVEDSGIGIQPEDLPRLFVEFQQLQTGGTKRYQGTGLGLALTKRIVEAQGGRVGVQSAPGQGSVFYAILPRVPQPTGAGASRPSIHS